MALTLSYPSGNSSGFFSTPAMPVTVPMGIGPAAADRIVVVHFGWVGASTLAGSDLSSVIINGVTASIAVPTNCTTVANNQAIAWALVPSGSGTQNIVVNCGGGTGFVTSSLMITANINGDPAAFLSSIQDVGHYTNGTASGLVTVPAGGVAALNCVLAGTPTMSDSWTGTASASDETGSNITGGFGSSVNHAIATATVSVTAFTNGGAYGWTSASFSPSAGPPPSGQGFSAAEW